MESSNDSINPEVPSRLSNKKRIVLAVFLTLAVVVVLGFGVKAALNTTDNSLASSKVDNSSSMVPIPGAAEVKAEKVDPETKEENVVVEIKEENEKVVDDATATSTEAEVKPSTSSGAFKKAVTANFVVAAVAVLLSTFSKKN